MADVYALISWVSLFAWSALVSYTLPASLRLVRGRNVEYLDAIKALLLMLAINRLGYALTAVVAPQVPGSDGYVSRMLLSAFSVLCAGGAIWVLKLYEGTRP